MRYGVWVLVLLAAALAGCAPGSGTSAPPTRTLEPSTNTPVPLAETPTVTQPPPPGPADVVTPFSDETSGSAQAIVGLVIDDLVQTLDVAAENVNVSSIQRVAWPDAGLGCASDVDEEDAADSGGGEPVAGYRIVLSYQGDDYEYHTDEEERFLLCESPQFVEGEPVILDPVVNSLVDLARRDLAERLDLPVRRVFLVDVTSFDWPDNSLGCPLGEQAFLPTPVFGYRIILRVGRLNYYYHSDYRQVLLCPEEAEQLPGVGETPEANGTASATAVDE